MAEQEGMHWATGRRKTSIARVRLMAGEGKFQINDRTLEEYFGRETSRMVVHEPFEVTNTRNRFDAVATIHGCGIAAQVQALRHRIARSRWLADGEHRLPLKKPDLLTRDPREVERSP